jgi:hypothetical protein
MLRPDELDPFFFQTTRELGVFGQEAIARMNRLSTGLLAGGDDLVDRQVGLFRGRRSDTNRFVGDLTCSESLSGSE